MKNLQYLLILLLILTAFQTRSQDLAGEYYLPGQQFDEALPSPGEFFGHEIGDWHLDHSDLYAYARELAVRSDRAELEVYGRSHEQKELFTLIVSSPENLDRLDEIRESRESYRLEGKGEPDDIPLVLYQGYSIHGDEASGANASALYAYYLLAAESEWLDEALEEVIILIDPTFNPDGLDRFASWANSNKNLHSTPLDGAGRMHHMYWPGGRTNHYWFDLNRDWLPARHPESRGRLGVFHKWHPNVLTDHHEMGADRTFFFQPGIPGRTNPLTPQENQEITAALAEFHAAALDEIGSLYYTKESFDDFYYGKGSTYPDINGSVGILFEQAGVEGFHRRTENGILSFPFAIRNQLVTSISTLKGALAHKQRLLNFQREFVKGGMEEAASLSASGYLIENGGDLQRLELFEELLGYHHLQYERIHRSGRETETESPVYDLYIPFNQPGYPLIKAFFQQEKSFQDSLFYDVSAWTMPLAFNLPYQMVDNKPLSTAGRSLRSPAAPEVENPVALLFEWELYYSPALLYTLQESGIRAKVSRDGFQERGEHDRSYSPGSIVVYLQNQDMPADELIETAEGLAFKHDIPVYRIGSGLAGAGPDLGSPSIDPVQKPDILLMAGDGLSAYDAGEVWHLLDHSMGIPVTRVAPGDIGRVDLSAYNVIVMPEGNYGSLGSKRVEELKNWVREGGSLILLERAINWGIAQGFSSLQSPKGEKAEENNDTEERRPYEFYNSDRGAERLGGAIFETTADLSHPLLFGYADGSLPVFKVGTATWSLPDNLYASPLVFTGDPLMSGYASDKFQNELAGTAALTVDALGRGRVINFNFNPNFRAFWLGTQKLFLNAVFFSPTISSGTAGE